MILNLIEIKHKLKNGQDIWRASSVRALVAEIETLKQNQTSEVDEFNSGYEAAQRGEPIENEPRYTPYDVWKIGWVWGKYQQAEQLSFAESEQ